MLELELVDDGLPRRSEAASSRAPATARPRRERGGTTERPLATASAGSAPADAAAQAAAMKVAA